VEILPEAREEEEEEEEEDDDDDDDDDDVMCVAQRVADATPLTDGRTDAGCG